MKRKRNKKISLIILGMAITLFLTTNISPPDYKFVKAKKYNSRQSKKVHTRSPASVKFTKNIQFIKNREVSSNKPIKDPTSLTVTNKLNKKWKQRLITNISKNFFEEKIKLDIVPIKSIVYVKNEVGILAEKVKVSIERENGKKSNFTALINSETGTIIQTWNQRRYENKERLELSGQGAEYTDY